MTEFLRWLGAVGLPFASFGLGFSIALLIISPRKARGGVIGTLIISAAATFICAIQLIADPVIDPIWLQYLVLIGVPFVIGALLLLRRRRKTDEPDEGNS